jgi:hypothetical protein
VAANLARLFGPAQVAGSPTSYFTAQAVTEIRKLTFNNPSTTTAYQVSVWVAPAGSGATTTTQMITNRTLQPQEAWDVRPLIGHVLNIGDQLFAAASSPASVNLLASGLVVS